MQFLVHDRVPLKGDTQQSKSFRLFHIHDTKTIKRRAKTTVGKSGYRWTLLQVISATSSRSHCDIISFYTSCDWRQPLALSISLSKLPDLKVFQ